MREAHLSQNKLKQASAAGASGMAVRHYSKIGQEFMVHWEHRYLLGTMIFTIAGDVVRDFDEEYEAWSWLEQEGWGLVAIEPPDPVRPGACKYYFKRQRPPEYLTKASTTETHATVKLERRERR